MTTTDYFDSRPNLGCDAYRLSVRDSTVGKGSIVAGVLWLARVVIAAAPSLIPQPAALAAPAKCSLPLEHDAETWKPALGKDHANKRREHDPEKACSALDPEWKPVFGKDRTQTRG